FVLWAERDPIEAPRTLLGKPTECLGRETELEGLARVFDACVTTNSPRAIVVTGAAGIGKSRLCQEFVRRLCDARRPPPVWTARGDPLASASAFGVIAQVLRREAGLLDGEALDERRHKLKARIARHLGATGVNPFALPEDEIARVTEFLGELVAASFPEEQS